MDTPTSPDQGPAETSVTDGVSVPRAYEPPKLVEYGPLAKITQGAVGSTGETSNKRKKV